MSSDDTDRGVVIRQNRCNWYTGVSLLAALAMMAGTVIGMLSTWPPTASYGWFMLPLLFLGSGAMAACYAYQIFRPKEHIIEISSGKIHIIDSIYGKWQDYDLDPTQISEFVNHEDGAMFIMKSRKAHALSSMLGIRSREIRQALMDLHPDIKIPKY